MNPDDRKSAFQPPGDLEFDVYVFSSRPDGLHGQADAGWAFKGSPDADWHTNPIYQANVNSPGGVGQRAVWRCAKGLQQGSEGLGYAIPCAFDWALGSPGLASSGRYEHRRQVEVWIAELVSFALSKPSWLFHFGPVGLTPEWGGAGIFNVDEMRLIMKRTPGIRSARNLRGGILPALPCHRGTPVARMPQRP